MVVFQHRLKDPETTTALEKHPNVSDAAARVVSDSSVSLIGLDSVKVGARLCKFVNFWKSLSEDTWIERG